MDLLCLLLAGGGDGEGECFLRERLSSSEPLLLRGAGGGGGEDSDSSRVLGFLAAAGDPSVFDLLFTGGGDGDPLDDRSLVGDGDADSLGDLFLLGGGGGESLGERLLAEGGESLDWRFFRVTLGGGGILGDLFFLT